MRCMSAVLLACVVGVLAAAAMPSYATVHEKAPTTSVRVRPDVWRTHARMLVVYVLQRDSMCEQPVLANGVFCADYRADVALVHVLFFHRGRVIYDESGDGSYGTFEQRVPFRQLRAEVGRCVPGFYTWRVRLLHPTVPAFTTRTGRIRLYCSNGQLTGRRSARVLASKRV